MPERIRERGGVMVLGDEFCVVSGDVFGGVKVLFLFVVAEIISVRHDN